MNINKTGFYILNILLLLSIILGFYELVEIKTLVGVFITPAFIVAASLGLKAKRQKQKIHKDSSMTTTQNRI